MGSCEIISVLFRNGTSHAATSIHIASPITYELSNNQDGYCMRNENDENPYFNLRLS